ncbi:MAG: DegT/DnrJ/EryC1/StrS family aminotransferase, partial [Telluria sp.]
DLASIATLLGEAGTAACVLLVPHYFGVEQPAATMAALADLCRRHGMLLIEDCAHAWMLAQHRVGAGRPAGRMVVASPYKYFACPDGGMLWGEPALLPAQGGGPGLLAELNAMRAISPHEAGALPAPAPLPDAIVRGAERCEQDDHPSHYYDAALERRDALLLSRWLIRRARPEVIARQRRQRYRQWLDAVSGLTKARALFPVLPDTCAPYMFPLLISCPDPDFFRLKQAGLPIWRWDDMAVSPCAVAARYRTQLLHLPCHQRLSNGQMDWMLALVREVLA